MKYIMKITVINYEELNKIPTTSQVVSDIIKAYENSSYEMHEDMGIELEKMITDLQDESLRQEAEKNIYFVDTSSIRLREFLIEDLRKQNQDLIVSYNLAGFECTTLTDSLGYNLVDCRQFHFITKKGVPGEKYLSKQKSINMFMFCDYRE